MLPPDAPKTETVSWGVERADGGRGFGMVMPHFYKSWTNDDLRRFILNGILWTAKLAVPPAGVGPTGPIWTPSTRFRSNSFREGDRRRSVPGHFLQILASSLSQFLPCVSAVLGDQVLVWASHRFALGDPSLDDAPPDSTSDPALGACPVRGRTGLCRFGSSLCRRDDCPLDGPLRARAEPAIRLDAAPGRGCRV